MVQGDRIRRKQLIREAEGYLDLATAFDDRWPLELPLRKQLARRALACLSQLEADSGRRSAVRYLQGQSHRISDECLEAISYLESAAELDPDSVQVLLALGWCYKRTGRLEQAIEVLERAVELDTENDVAHYNLACYWALASQTKLAVYHLSAALDLNPSLRRLIVAEPDFDLVRSDPDFLAVTSVIV